MSMVEFHNCCHRIIQSKANGYAKRYAEAGLWIDDRESAKVQALYILSNITHWRENGAKEIRAKLKEIAKVKS